MEPCEARLVRRVKGRVCAQQVPLLECAAAAAAAAATTNKDAAGGPIESVFHGPPQGVGWSVYSKEL